MPIIVGFGMLIHTKSRRTISEKLCEISTRLKQSVSKRLQYVWTISHPVLASHSFAITVTPPYSARRGKLHMPLWLTCR